MIDYKNLLLYTFKEECSENEKQKHVFKVVASGSESSQYLEQKLMNKIYP